jgi:hypothetical protein
MRPPPRRPSGLRKRRRSAPRARWLGAVAARLTRRRDAGATRVTVRDAAGQAQVLPGSDPRAQALEAAAQRVLLAAQRASGR